MGRLALAAAATVAAISAGDVAAQNCAAYPNTLTNGTTADASQVMANFNLVRNCANTLAPIASPLFTGNLGIGVSGANALVDAGTSLATIKFSVYNTGGANVYGIGVNPGLLTFGAALASVTSTPQMVLTQLGNVGIGTTTPVTNLDVNGGIHVVGNLASPNLTEQGLTIDWNLLAGYIGETDFINNEGGGSGAFAFMNTSSTGSGRTTLMYLHGDGFLGIGTTSPSYTLHVNGTAYASGAAGALSDIRHKDDVRTLPPGALKIVEELRPVNFVWKEPKDDGMRGVQTGFIAQEVQNVMPSAVLTEGNLEKTLDLKYNEFIPLLVAAVQEQQTEITELRAQIAELKAKP